MLDSEMFPKIRSAGNLQVLKHVPEFIESCFYPF